MVVHSVSIENLVDMQSEPLEPELPWTLLPWAKTTVRRLKGLFDTSTLCGDCEFDRYIGDLHKLKAQEFSFGVASAKFIEGKEIALKLQQYLEENQQHHQTAEQHEPNHQHPLPRQNEASTAATVTETVAPKFNFFTPSSGEIPPLPPDNPAMIRRFRDSIHYNFDDFWEFCVHAQKNTKTPLGRRDLALMFEATGNYPDAKKRTVDKWIYGPRMRFSEQQVHSAAGLSGDWPPDLHTQPVQPVMSQKRCRGAKKGKSVDDDDDDDGILPNDQCPATSPPDAAPRPIAAAAAAASAAFADPKRAAAAAAASSSDSSSAAAPPKAAPPGAASAAAGAGLEHYPNTHPLSLPAAVGRGVREEARGGGSRARGGHDAGARARGSEGWGREGARGA